MNEKDKNLSFTPSQTTITVITIFSLPVEVVELIIKFLNESMMLTSRLVCKNFYQFVAKIYPEERKNQSAIPRIPLIKKYSLPRFLENEKDEKKDAFPFQSKINIHIPEFRQVPLKWIFFIYKQQETHLQVLDIETNQIILSLAHSHRIAMIRSTPSSDKVIVLGGFCIYVWDIPSGQLIEKKEVTKPTSLDEANANMLTKMAESSAEYSTSYSKIRTELKENSFSNYTEIYAETHIEKTCRSLKLGKIDAKTAYLTAITKDGSRVFNIFTKGSDFWLQTWVVKSGERKESKLPLISESIITQIFTIKNGAYLAITVCHNGPEWGGKLIFYSTQTNSIMYALPTNEIADNLLNFSALFIVSLATKRIACLKGCHYVTGDILQEAEVYTIEFPELLDIRFCYADGFPSKKDNQNREAQTPKSLFPGSGFLTFFSGIFSKEPKENSEPKADPFSFLASRFSNTLFSSIASTMTTNTAITTTTTTSAAIGVLPVVFQPNTNRPSGGNNSTKTTGPTIPGKH